MFPDASSAIPRGFSPVVPTVVALPAGLILVTVLARELAVDVAERVHGDAVGPGIGLCQAHGLVGPWLIRGGRPDRTYSHRYGGTAVTKNVPRRRRESVAMGTAFIGTRQR